MKKSLSSLILVLLQASFCFAGEKVTFRLSSDGPDNSLSAAVAKARAHMLAHPGDDVDILLHKGTYRMTDSVLFDGNWIAGSLTIMSAPGERASIAGDVRISGWKKYRKNIWMASLTDCGISDHGEPVGKTNRIDLYRAGRRQTLARWPDTGFTAAGKALGATELPSPDWIQYHGTKEGIIGYLDDRIDRWGKEKDGYAFGYFYWDWSEHVNHISSVDKARKILNFEAPFSYYGYRDSCRFYGFNLMCELDSPGEYYIDREKDVIYWFAPDGVDPEEEDLSVSVFNGEHMITVSSAANFVIKGIDFRGGRKGAVAIFGGSSNKVEDCNFRCFGGVVVTITGGCGHTIDRCVLKELGMGGIRAIGGDRKTLEPSGFAVTNTVIENFSLFKRTYQPAIYFSGAGMLIAHNSFSNSSSSALRLEGNDITVEYNRFCNLVNESDDQGATDVWYNYSFRRTVYRFNHFKNISGGIVSGAAGIRFDDIISGQVVYGNVFEHCGGTGFGGVQIHGGNFNWIANNLFYDCPYAISCTPWDDEKWDRLFKGQLDKCNKVDCFGALYRTRYPELNQDPSYGHNTNFSSDNLVVNAEGLYLRGDALVCRNDTLVKDSSESISHFLQPSVLASFGLKEIPFDKIGITK